MGLRTPEEYVESLRDGRRVMFRGAWVEDVTAHPVLRLAIDHAAIDYAIAEDPHFRDLCTAEQDGETVSRFYKLPKTAEDLLLRMRAIEAVTTEGRTVVTLIHEIGTDALFAHAAHLRRVELVEPRNVVGKSTVESIQSGVIYGHTALIDGVCRRIMEDLGPTTVIATGGLAAMIRPLSMSAMRSATSASCM